MAPAWSMSFRARYAANLDHAILHQDVLAYHVGGPPPVVCQVLSRHGSPDGTVCFALRHRISGRLLLIADASGAFVGNGDRLTIRIGSWIMVRRRDPIPHGPPERLAAEVLTALTTPPRERLTVDYPGYRRAWWAADRWVTSGLLATGLIERVGKDGD